VDVADALAVGVGRGRAGAQRQITTQALGGREAGALADQVHGEPRAARFADAIGDRDAAERHGDGRRERAETRETAHERRPHARELGLRGARGEAVADDDLRDGAGHARRGDARALAFRERTAEVGRRR